MPLVSESRWSAHCKIPFPSLRPFAPTGVSVPTAHPTLFPDIHPFLELPSDCLSWRQLAREILPGTERGTERELLDPDAVIADLARKTKWSLPTPAHPNHYGCLDEEGQE